MSALASKTGGQPFGIQSITIKYACAQTGGPQHRLVKRFPEGFFAEYEEFSWVYSIIPN